MKLKITLLGLTAIGMFVLFLSNKGGTGGSTLAPGESHTCSQPTCHGAGNGSGSSGGIADNAGPGSLIVSAVPAMTNNQYTPGQLYHVTVTVSETGKTIFGFTFQSLDNSGNTNLHIDNTIGTFTLTNSAATRFSQSFGTGRKTVTFQLNAGLANNTKSFTFDWTAPQTGTVNWYYSGLAANNDVKENAADNVYTSSQQLTPAVVSSTNEITTEANAFVFPNPSNNNVMVSFNNPNKQLVSIQLYSLEGKLIKTLDSATLPEGNYSSSYSTTDLESGTYLLKISGESININKQLMIN